ncbi:MAG: histidine kinase dimerization/phospho-acceptor domain-containing protein, partial [Gaiellaceae bacterium]
MRRFPIRLRLTLAFAVVMAVVLAGVGLFVYRRVANELLASVDQTLHAQAADAESRAGHESNLVDPDVSGGTTLAQLLASNGTVAVAQPAGVGPLLTPPEAARAAAGTRVLVTRSIPGRRGEWRVLGVAVPTAGVVALARPLQARAESLEHLRHELSLVLPLALLAASAGGYLLAAGALRPVEAMRRRAAAVTADRPGSLPVPPAHDELSRLALTLNAMLARLQESFEHERRFVADASHELRTPLALLRAELELALRRPRSREELAEALRSAADETERLSRLAEDLLLIARGDQGGLPIRPARIPADDVLGDVAGRFAARADELGRELRVEPSQALLEADPARIEQALGNLVQNAL